MIIDLKKLRQSLIRTVSTKEIVTYSIQHSKEVKPFLATRQEGTFGFEYYMDSIDKKLNFFSNSSLSNLSTSRSILLDPIHSNQSCYYLEVLYPNYAPFSFKSVEDTWTLIQRYTQSLITKDVKLHLQCLFQFNSNEKWKITSYDKYNGYLDGVMNLSMNKHIQSLQYKLVSLFNSNKPPHIDETIEKLEQDGYSTCVRVVIEGDDSTKEKIMKKILLAFNTQRFVNGWETRRVNNKQKFITDYQARLLPNQYRDQILCPSEMGVFFGGGVVDKESLTLKPVTKMVQEQNPEIKSNLKPLKKLVLDPDTEIIVDDLTAAMKKLKLTKGDELKVVDFKKSLTLNIISFERPADLTMDKLRKRIEDLEIEMHIEGISFDQGTQKGSIAMLYPRKDREFMTLKNMLNKNEIKLLIKQQELPIVVGIDMYGNPLIYDLTRLVHILIAGGTGMGKSVFENVLLLSLTFFLSPDELELYLIDPKLVELSDYENFPHVKQLVTDCKKARNVLNKVVNEMDERYKKLKEAGVRDIQQFNRKCPHEKFPYIVVVIDEFADLMMIDSSVEDFVQRLGQKARGCGIHLIICTQRPSVDVITGVIKANMMTRIGFTCKSHHDYKTIFDYMIPYRLVGKGDGVMNWHENDSQFIRFQSPFNADEDMFDEIINKWGGNAKQIRDEVEPEELDDIDDKYLLLKKVICETGETRMKQLREMTKLNQNKLQEYIYQLIEEGWLQKGETRQSGYRLTLTDIERDIYLDTISEDD